MTESMSIGSMIVSAGFADYAMCLTSSHFCSSEIQFRNPLEYGGQRTPSAQWTVTGAGCAILSSKGTGPKITHVTTGKVIDKGVTDISNMGAAMAPAAIDTLGFDIRTKHKDCGKMIFDIEEQDVHAGGSGCGCCGSVFCGYVYRELKRHNLSKVLVMATGALMNPMIIEQGESIPAIAHAVAIEI